MTCRDICLVHSRTWRMLRTSKQTKYVMQTKRTSFTATPRARSAKKLLRKRQWRRGTNCIEEALLTARFESTSYEQHAARRTPDRDEGSTVYLSGRERSSCDKATPCHTHGCLTVAGNFQGVALNGCMVPSARLPPVPLTSLTRGSVVIRSAAFGVLHQ